MYIYILCLVTDVLYRPDEAYDHMLSREYTWNVKNKATKGYEEMYFFLERGGQFCYNELETRVRLTKRRKTGNLALLAFLVISQLTQMDIWGYSILRPAEFI